MGGTLCKGSPQGLSKVVTGQLLRIRTAASWVRAAAASPDASALLHSNDTLSEQCEAGRYALQLQGLMLAVCCVCLCGVHDVLAYVEGA